MIILLKNKCKLFHLEFLIIILKNDIWKIINYLYTYYYKNTSNVKNKNYSFFFWKENVQEVKLFPYCI